MSNDENKRLGRRLRALRRERGLSLSEVAEATDISPSFLSHIENGKGDITFSRLSRLVGLYGVSMLDLAPETRPRAHVVRADEREQVPSRVRDVHLYRLAPRGSGFSAVSCEYHPGADSGFGTPHTIEFVHVLQGTLEIEFADGSTVRLAKGDSAYLADPHAERCYRNAGRGVSKHISVLARGPHAG